MPKIVPSQDPTPQFVRQVLELYSEALADVRFPDLDLAALTAARDELQNAQLQVDAADAELQRARAALDAQSAGLVAIADRALAYARVFASTDAALQARVAEVGRKRATPPAEGSPNKRRGRVVKADAAHDLFGADPEASSGQEAVLEVGALEH